MFLRKQALLVFRGSSNPCFVIKTSKHTTLLYVRFSSKTFLLAKGKFLLANGKLYLPLLCYKNKVFISKKAFVIFFTHLCEKYNKASFRLALLEVLFNQGLLIFQQK
jgi:hypothetical protein